MKPDRARVNSDGARGSPMGRGEDRWGEEKHDGATRSTMGRSEVRWGMADAP